MPVEAAEMFLPKGDGMTEAFQRVSAQHGLRIKTAEELSEIPFGVLVPVVADYFTAAVAYLANRGHDDYIRDAGTIAWWTINQGRIRVVLTDDMVKTAVERGVPLPLARSNVSRNDEPHVLFFTSGEKGKPTEMAYLLLPPQLLVRAQERPIEALAGVAWICSQARDLANGRLTPQDYLNFRAEATEAHFLLEAQRRYPSLRFSPAYLKLMERYPQGLESLPMGIRYKGISGTEFRQALNN